MNRFYLFRTRFLFSTTASVLFFLMLPALSFGQTFFGTSSNPADGGAQAAATLVLTPPAAMQAGDLVVIFAHGRATGLTLGISAAGGQTWTSEALNNGSTQSARTFWCRFNGTWATSPSVNGGGSNPYSASMYVFRPTNSAHGWTINMPQVISSASGTTQTITGHTTTASNTVTMAFWSGADDVSWTAAAGAGWSQTGLPAQIRNTSGSDQSHTAAYNIQAPVAALTNVSKTQSSNVTTRKSIISFQEVPPPSNDDCINAVNLAVMSACNNIPGTMASATPSAIPLGGACSGSLVADVWYKFTAVNSTATVTLGSVGSGLNSPRIEVLSGTCGSFSTVACGTSGLTMASLTPGTTYYVRVYASTGGFPLANSGFNICITSSQLPVVRYGNSYVNISKKTTGGVVEPGDTLEIRMTIQHSVGTTMNNLRFVDNVPTNTTMLTGTNDSIRVITNEGLTYKKYTLTTADDAASYLPSPPAGQFNIRMNLGFGTSNPGIPPNNTSTNITNTTGTMVNTNLPRGGGTALLFATAYRVVASGTVGDTITLHPAQFIYRTASGDVTLTATSYKILISDPMDLCANSIGINNAAELGGTFGTGTTLNRPTDLTTPIPGYSFLNNVSGSNGLGDGRYAIVKNISPRSSTNKTANHVPNCGSLPADDPDNCNNRMHGGHWDIDGDHTNTNNSIGNNPPDASTLGGYMLMVNADYVASEVFSQTLNNLCPNTYYEFSAWFRNICSTCGMDSTGAQFDGTVTAPAAGYVGVYPNLSFALDGLDYYSTGEIDLGGWQKKGFVFRTGATQTSATFSIRNNSQGGGGNDWVMDDIAVATCLPTMSYSPTINPNVCELNPIVIADTVSSYFNNYTTYKWQRSTNGGTNWTDITGVTTLPDTNYYITTYTVSPANTTLSDSGTLYRVVVATTADNLSDPNCNISDGVTITLHVLDCDPVLDIDFIYFNGLVVNGKAQLAWNTSYEDGPVSYLVERSPDGREYSEAGTLAGNNDGSNTNFYKFNDAYAISDKVWYRVVMVSANGKKKYSTSIQLYNKTPDFQISNLINPFNNALHFNLTVVQSSAITTELIDMSGKTVLSGRQLVYSGTNSVTLRATQSLPAGVYTMRVTYKDKFITRRVVKNN